MKYDCYPRFLRSPYFRECLQAMQQNEQPPIAELTLNDPDLNIDYDFGEGDSDSLRNLALKKSGSDAGERRRRSLLPWPKKDRSKSKVCSLLFCTVFFERQRCMTFSYLNFVCRIALNLITERRPRRKIDRVVPVAAQTRKRRMRRTMKICSLREPHPRIRWHPNSVTRLSTSKTLPVLCRWSKSFFPTCLLQLLLPGQAKVFSNFSTNFWSVVAYASMLSSCLTATIPPLLSWNGTLLWSVAWKSA